MFKVNLKGTTIPHTGEGHKRREHRDARPGTTGNGRHRRQERAPVLELAGVTDILTKAYGSTSPKNLVKATMAAASEQLHNKGAGRARSAGVETERKRCGAEL